MARLRDPVECRPSKAVDAIENTNASRQGGASRSSTVVLLGDDGCALSDGESNSFVAART